LRVPQSISKVYTTTLLINISNATVWKFKFQLGFSFSSTRNRDFGFQNNKKILKNRFTEPVKENGFRSYHDTLLTTTKKKAGFAFTKIRF